MDKTTNIDPLYEQYRMKKLGKDQKYLAKKLNRTEASISLAFKGKVPTVLERIKKHLDYLEVNQIFKEHKHTITQPGNAIS